MHRRDVLKNLSVMLGGTLSVACQQALQVPVNDRLVTQPLYSDLQRATAHKISDLIIPDTDTPGAQKAGVGEFIDYVISQWYRAPEQQIFLDGLNALMAESDARYGQPFTDLPEAAQVAQLTELERTEGLNADDAENEVEGFFARIKELTVVGYYTSEVGVTQELAYTPMPGRYDGYFKFSDVGRQWSS